MRPLRLHRGWVVLLGLLPETLPAQSIRGRLVDADEERPVPSATVTLLADQGQAVRRVLTDGGGAFAIHAPGAGRYRLQAERIGYQPAVSPPLDLLEGDTVAVELRLAAAAVLLAPLTVTATSRRGVRDRSLDGFYERRDRGIGRFFTPEEVQRFRATHTSNLLQVTPGVNLSYPRGSPVRPRVTLRGARRECVPSFYLNGHPVPLDGDVSIDDWVSAHSLRALEVYRSRLETPAEFLSAADCGVIVAWTHVGLGDPREYREMRAQTRRALTLAVRAVIAAGTLFLASRL